jgi:hypothetical protein
MWIKKPRKPIPSWAVAPWASTWPWCSRGGDAEVVVVEPSARRATLPQLLAGLLARWTCRTGPTR